ncbi:MAG: inositol-3-phosphate synthase [Planctomycetes bacterium]|nr:inositol-3-phosphate synthase [Planctomycetota bacterium]
MTETEKSNERLGVWLVGARGAISTCVAYGLAGLVEGLLEPVGLCTETEALSGLDLCAFDDIVLGGCDVCERSLTESAAELEQHGLLSPALITGVAARAAAYEERIVPGVLDPADGTPIAADPESERLGSLPSGEQVAAITAALETFKEGAGVSRVIVVNLASSEAQRAPSDSWEDLAAFEAALEAGEPQPSSVLYAYAALKAGHPFVNFTPSAGASIPALRELAEAQGVPVAGSDGKTGETLVKTVLAPMFSARALKVLAWQGYNMLGNRDGEVLEEPAHKAAKLHNKDQALRELLGNDDLHSEVAIDFVPSLNDWKTAWDFIHFEGFLGAKMSMQFTWQGSDSALAAPLVLDLVRLTDEAARAGHSGDLDHLACFFKAPLSGGTHDFHQQHYRLLSYAAKS